LIHHQRRKGIKIDWFLFWLFHSQPHPMLSSQSGQMEARKRVASIQTPERMYEKKSNLPDMH
jgi:hypothetical protein